ncbi:MAG: teicoplanin resistance protein VanZ [Parcubacteria group bacterium CG22_combo_CG10-13_8_21_14_all_41_9]|nr:MAG: teicoplanin resistance protein VanZ [Parcubacteria group bacterium CG22_combo_CG10-13_8_21_14_all_41_9]
MARFFIAVSAESFAQATGISLGEFFSVEAGQADGLRHFDHHRPEHRANPAPCADGRIPAVGDDEMIVITHMDADTFVGLLRLSGRPLPEVDFSLMEKVDLNGSSVIEDLFNPTLLYMVGVGEVARGLKFPRPSTDGSVEVTGLVEQLLDQSSFSLLVMGISAQTKSEAAYERCQRDRIGNPPRVGLWVVGPDDAFDPSRPYRDGFEVVVVYRSHYESVSIYCSPSSEWAFGGQEVGGIQFAGHPKACGSPRGLAFTEGQAGEVFDAVAKAMGIKHVYHPLKFN